MSATRKTIKFAGLIPFEESHIDPDAPGSLDAIVEMLQAAAPSTRLQAIKERAARYQHVPEVEREIVAIEHMIDNPDRHPQVAYMLLALERGLDLLDHGQFLKPVLMGDRSSKAHSAAGSAPRKLSDHERKAIRRAYRRRLDAGERYGAIKALAGEYDVSATTIRAVLKETE